MKENPTHARPEVAESGPASLRPHDRVTADHCDQQVLKRAVRAVRADQWNGDESVCQPETSGSYWPLAAGEARALEESVGVRFL
jgi:hypothetical protein